MKRRIPTVASLLVLLLLALFGGAQWLTQEPSEPAPAPAVGSAAAPTSALDRFAAEERRAIGDTLALIDAGGPFPYRKDGSRFGNREGRLPAGPPGYYREYTVETPGSPDRGARRIVAGHDGDRWYTDDHYGSFVRLQ